MLLVSFGLSGFHAEDDPNDAYAYDRTESVLHLSLEAPAGTSLSAGGPAANIGIYVQRHSWEIWRQASTGLEEYRDANNAPESGASVNLSLSDAMGTLGNSTVITNADGFAYTTYSPDGGSGSVYVNAAVENSTASLFFDVTYTTTGYDESYSYSHTEATLVAELITNGSTDHVYSGETRELSLSVRYETWDVMTNSLGQSYTENHTSAPAEGAAVTWISEIGDASVSGYGMVDAAGLCQGSLMMGSGNSVVRAEISYAAGQATSASLYFAAAPYYDPSGGDPSSGDPSTMWSYSRSETIASISNLSAGGSTDMSTGETRHLTGEVRHEVWDVWVNGYGMEDWRYNYAGPAAWATVTAAIEFGDGSLGSTTVTSDGQGWFSLDYTMGSSSSRVTVSADGATSASGTNGSASVDFTYSSTTGQPDYGNGYDNGGTSSPSLLSYDGSYRIEGPHSDGPTYDLTPGTQRTVSGVLYWDSWEVWSDGSGNTTIQNHQSHPATWSGLTLSLAQGDGTLADSSITTDSSGGFSTTFTMGNVASRVRVEATGGSSGTIAAELDFTPPPAGPVDDFVKVREESSLFVGLTSGTPQAGTEAIPLEAQVTETTWEVWENGIAPAELRNYRTGPAIAASVEFSIASGSGELTAIDSLTDADGTARASIIPGQADTVVAVNASFLTTGASGQITVSPVPWERQSIESSLLLSLQQTDNTVTATVRLQSWEIWVNPATGLGEPRHESEGPAVNAEVIFQSLATSGYDASFYTPTVMTATDGTASTNYTSLDATMAQVTAHFAGQSVTETIQLPTASGSNGTGTWNGTDWNGGSGGGGSGGTGGGGSGGGGSGVTAPRIPVNIRGRYHQTSGGSGTPSSEATDNPDEGKDTIITGEGPALAPYHELLQLNYSDARYDEVTLYERFEATLVRDVLANDGVTVTGEEEKEVEGLVVDKEEILAPDLEDRWRVRDEEEFDPYQGYRWEVSFASSINYNTSDSDATGEALEVNGRTSPSSDASLLTTLASEHEIKSLYEQVGSPPDPTVYWNGSVGDMGFGAAPWSSSERLEEGGNTNSPTASELDSYADFVSGVTPSVKWSEYWGQTDAPVPTDGGPAKSTVVFFAKSIDEDGETTSTGTVTVTFTIEPGQRVSTETPVIESSSGSMGSWIVAQSDGTVRAEPPVERGKRNVVGALAVEMKVDYDRDGDDDILGDAGDSIPQGERFRFWINDDSDVGDDREATDTDESQEDGGNDYIDGFRDLEDFTRLHIDLSSVKTMIEDGMQVGLKMNGGGSIGVNYAADQDAGSEKFLFDQQEAFQQRTIEYTGRRMLVGSSESWFPADVSGRINSDGKLHLIFEGVTQGEGAIVLILKPTNGSTIEGPTVPIKLMPVAKMYEHWTAGDYNASVGDREAVHATIAGIQAYPSKTTESGVFEVNGREEDDVIVFVHGWRMTPWDRRSFGDTSFKRLWHSGFKGKFFNFSWPTGFTERFNVPGGPPHDPDNYADSEEIAYHVGEKPLKNFLDYLQSKYPGKVNLFAHSMGGVVSSTALKYGGQVETYAACQTAMVGHSYDPQFESRMPALINWETPEVYANYPPTGVPYFESITQKTFNFYNRDDNALDGWEYGQNLKPNESEGYKCHAFNAATNEGNFLYIAYPTLTFPSETYEIYAHCAEARSYALGARELAGAKGNFDLQNFSDGAFDFTNEPEDHSGQWNGTMMIRHEFWRVLLLDAFGLNISKESE